MGARILNYVLLVVAGIVLGVLGTVAQQTILSIGSAQLPSGLIIALVAVGCLLVGLRLVNDSRWPSFAAGLGVVIPAVVFALPSEGGSVIIPGNAYGYEWILGTFALVVVIVGWPSLGARASTRIGVLGPEESLSSVSAAGVGGAAVSDGTAVSDGGSVSDGASVSAAGVEANPVSDDQSAPGGEVGSAPTVDSRSVPLADRGDAVGDAAHAGAGHDGGDPVPGDSGEGQAGGTS